MLKNFWITLKTWDGEVIHTDRDAWEQEVVKAAGAGYSVRTEDTYEADETVNVEYILVGGKRFAYFVTDENANHVAQF